MGGFLSGIMGNDSPFGRLMTRVWIIVCSNILFVIFSLPVVTAGPAFAALYYVNLKSFRGDGVSNPFREFWNGFKSNFKQGMICGLLFTGFAALAYVELQMLRAADAPKLMRYGVLGVSLVVLILAVHLFPVMAAFADTIPHLVRNAVFFAAKNPVRMLALAALYVVPLVCTYIDEYMRPLYAFLWAFFGFGAIASIASALLIRDFSKYLPPVDGGELLPEGGEEPPAGGSALTGAREIPSRRETLRNMKKLKM